MVEMSERYRHHNMRGSDGPCDCDDCRAESGLATEVERLTTSMQDRRYATVYERTAWHHDIGEHDGSEYPYGFCPRCEMEHPLGRYRVVRDALALAATALERAQPDAHDRKWYLDTVLPTVKRALGLTEHVGPDARDEEG